MSDVEEKSKNEQSTDEYELLLERFYGDFYIPVNWEQGKKSKNYFANIERGKKFLFKRDFLRTQHIDDEVVFKKDNFPENKIIEQRCTFVKGQKEEVTFGGFFIIHHVDGNIYGEEISQKEALEYFDCKDMFPEASQEKKNEARVDIATAVRGFMRKYGDELVSEVLVDILNDYFPDSK